MSKRKPTDEPMLPQFQPAPFKPTESTVGKDLQELRKALFEAICDECGIDASRVTEDERGVLNRTVKQILDAGATVEDVGRVAGGIRRAWPDNKLTPNFIRCRWGEFVGGGPPKLVTVNYGVSTKSEPNEFNREAENRECIARSERVAELSESRLNQLRQRAIDESPNRFVRDYIKNYVAGMNLAICELLDGGA